MYCCLITKVFIMKKVLSVIFILTFAVSATVAAVFAAKSSIMIECNSYSIESYSFDPNGRYCCPLCRGENTWIPASPNQVGKERTYICNTCGYEMTFVLQ